ncbi:hypothetical protein FN846DRAFT_887948 [Sphaerosporella brunnea]|uniref:Uncharacterized protein n=1 Tax=Sphaerosporella brunnea TaxID=1250544 RepID=A0A5J5F411_9PEZI|nr:hypothetical protein FN846DRAFT_887948 [Sphaerosporella brunnea]
MTNKKICKVCAPWGSASNNSRHMRLHHHMYYCEEHDKYMRVVEYANLSTGWLECGCRLKLRIGKAAGWWKKLSTARQALDCRRAAEVEADMSDQDELVGDEAVAVEREEADAVECDMAGLPAQNNCCTMRLMLHRELGANDDFAALLAKLDVVDNKAEDQSRFRPRAYGSLPAMGAWGGNSTLPPRFVKLYAPVDPEDRQRQVQQQDDAVPADEGPQEIATWDKALLGGRVTSIACIRQLPGDKIIGWTPGSNEISYAANVICHFDAVCVVSEFARRMASLLADRDADHPMVLFLRGQSGSGKTWLARKLVEPVEGADISITSFEGGAAKRTIPPSYDKRRSVKLTKRVFDKLPKWSKTAKTAANESSSRAVVGYRMDGLLLIDMPGGEVVADHPEETRRINATNTEVLDTLHHFCKTGQFSNKCTRNKRAVGELFVNKLRILGVRVVVATVVRGTDVGNTKAFGPLKDRFQGQRSQQP